MRIKQKLGLVTVLALLVSFGMGGMAWAVQSSSSNFSVNEVFFGSGGSLHDCSTNYCAKLSAGETAVGNTNSASYQAQAGFNTDRTPFLEFVVNNTNLDIGELTSSTTKTATATFAVKTYLSSGYTVTQTSPGPTNGAYALAGMSSPAASAAGTEQFGINLKANTSPATFGANPTQNPDATFSHGQVSSGYNTSNQFKYVQNDTIAYSDQSSGETDYTISYIFNVSNLTAGGTYTLHHVLVATATF
ncbi:MAG: exported protein of unknown function [Candidatus Saccharibacteria bacterium]|nr:exported protein of unknown function [Candidatus Saccharibacteria bacterium]